MKVMEAVKSTIDLSGRSDRATEAIADLKSRLLNVGATKTDVVAVAKAEIVPVANEISSLKRSHQEALDRAASDLANMQSRVESLQKTVESLRKDAEMRNTAIVANQTAIEGTPQTLTRDEIIKGGGVVCAVSVLSALIVAFAFGRGKK